MEEKLDYSKLEEMYVELAKAKSYCPHTNAVSIDENNIVHFNCKLCGLIGMANIESAKRLGWIEQKELDKNQ